jgi:hypothetical protein
MRLGQLRQVKAGVAFARVGRSARRCQHLLRDLQLREVRAAAQLLDGVAIKIARGEIHGREFGRGI